MQRRNSGSKCVVATIIYGYTVKPLNKGHIGTSYFVMRLSPSRKLKMFTVERLSGSVLRGFTVVVLASYAQLTRVDCLFSHRSGGSI